MKGQERAGMILQNIVFPPDEACEKEIYVRGDAVSNWPDESCNIQQGEVISTDTYMNAFDIGVWKKYTNITELSLVWRFKGKGILKIYRETENEEAVCLAEMNVENQSNTLEDMRYFFRDFQQLDEGILYFKFYAEKDSFIEAWFETKSFGRKEIKISIVICTYKRKKQLEQIIKKIQNLRGCVSQKTPTLGALSESFKNREQGDNGNNDWLRTIVVDNASELEDDYGDGITIYHNPNTGGTGGFTRGMKETVKNLPEFQATHVVLMDDDVILRMESISRLHALLTYVRPEYEQEVVAGRMFRLDRPHVQYTAAEIWNGGDIKHIGLNQDMTDRQCLWNMNENEGGEYSGWWFACFPIEFVRENEPLPFFLHCDDVEYGLRHGGTPIVLNGIQVWHETYEYRQSPVITYYDRRNSMIVNEIYGCNESNRVKLWKKIKQTLKEVNRQRNYLLEYYMIRAYRDFLRGERWFMDNDARRLHTSLIQEVRANRFINALRRKALGICFFWKKDRELYTKSRLLPYII